MQAVGSEKGWLVGEHEKVMDIMQVCGVAGSLKPVMHGQHTTMAEVAAS